MYHGTSTHSYTHIHTHQSTRVFTDFVAPKFHLLSGILFLFILCVFVCVQSLGITSIDQRQASIITTASLSINSSTPPQTTAAVPLGAHFTVVL